MSAFDGTTPPAADPVITENFLENLVGDGKKFTDPEALAKGKYEADKFVEDLKRQNAELKEDIDKAAKIDELMELVRTQNKAPEEPTTPQVDPSITSSDHMTPEALKALIETHVTERDTQATMANNLAEADRTLTEKFGTQAESVLASRSAELGMSKDQMKELASKNPKAFLRLIGTDTATSAGGGLLGGSQRTEGVPVSSVGTRNAAYYNDQRRKDKGAYYAPKNQLQMIKDAEAMGPAFYGN